MDAEYAEADELKDELDGMSIVVSASRCLNPYFGRGLQVKLASMSPAISHRIMHVIHESDLSIGYVHFADEEHSTTTVYCFDPDEMAEQLERSEIDS